MKFFEHLDLKGGFYYEVSAPSSHAWSNASIPCLPSPTSSKSDPTASHPLGSIPTRLVSTAHPATFPPSVAPLLPSNVHRLSLLPDPTRPEPTLPPHLDSSAPHSAGATHPSTASARRCSRARTRCTSSTTSAISTCPSGTVRAAPPSGARRTAPARITGASVSHPPVSRPSFPLPSFLVLYF